MTERSDLYSKPDLVKRIAKRLDISEAEAEYHLDGFIYVFHRLTEEPDVFVIKFPFLGYKHFKPFLTRLFKEPKQQYLKVAQDKARRMIAKGIDWRYAHYKKIVRPMMAGVVKKETLKAAEKMQNDYFYECKKIEEHR
jgi:hypothetical protein